MKASELAKQLIDMAVEHNDPDVVVYEKYAHRREITDVGLEREQSRPTSPPKYTVVL